MDKNKPLDKFELERYSRNILLPGMGVAGQANLKQSRVLLIGAGGLGSPVGLYLAAAGVGNLRIVDDDIVSRSNLGRQVLFGNSDLDKLKASQAAERLSALNPHINIEASPTRLSPDNYQDFIEDVDLIIEGSDNFPTKFLANEPDCV